MINACLRLYDAVPYLTMLLFCKSSAPVSLLRRERGQKERSRVILKEICGREGTQRQGVGDTAIHRAKDKEFREDSGLKRHQ